MKTKNKILISCILFLLVVVSVFFVFVHKKKSAALANLKTTHSDVTMTYVVTYSEKGFLPRTIQVPRGQVVQFVNNSNTTLLIVADDQNSPLLNSLNQSDAVTRGGVYTFDFTYPGTWAYHNANVPDDHGNIVVY